MSTFMTTLSSQLAELVSVGAWIQANRWCPATSGNLSTRVLGEDVFHISVSGKYKGELTTDDFLAVTLDGNLVSPGRTPSAETLLHALIYRRNPEATFVLHSHSVYGTVLSRFLGDGALVFTDYELQKAFSGISTHETSFSLPIFANSQDMTALSQQINAYMDETPVQHGFLLAGHGVYTWGKSLAEAKRHLEALEFLFECEYKSRLLAR